jgi:hypothetical protein
MGQRDAVLVAAAYSERQIANQEQEKEKGEGWITP